MTIEEVKKRCTGECKDIKPLKDFHKWDKSKDGRRTRCKECTNKAKRLSHRAAGIEADELSRGKIKDNCMKAWWV